jgi:hypothetical protein
MSKVKKEQLVLPTKDREGNYYISYSQIGSYKRSVREYIRQKFFKEPFVSNPYMLFGTKVGEALEHNNFEDFTEDEQEFLKTVPRYDRFEALVHLRMKGFYVKGFIDTMKLPDDHKKGHIIKYVPAIADYKTGDIEKKRGDYESDEYIQLDIYAAHIEQTFGSLPKKVEVILIGRKGNAFKREELTLTKEFITINRKTTKKKVEAVKKIVQETAEEISEYYKVFLTLNV